MTNDGKEQVIPSKLKVTIVVSLCTLLYLAFVYKTWSNVQQLFSQIPSFLVSGISNGVICSLFTFVKPIRAAFFIGASGQLLVQ